jgi:hypothetical protein
MAIVTITMIRKISKKFYLIFIPDTLDVLTYRKPFATCVCKIDKLGYSAGM